MELRQDTVTQQLVDYFEDNPYTHDDCTHLRKFIAAPHDSSNQSDSSADNEPANAKDQFIESVQDFDTHLQLRSCRYLQRIQFTAWGSNVVQGLADLLHMDIDILSTRNPNMQPVRSHHRPARGVHLGLIGQFHVSLVAITTINTAVPDNIQSTFEPQQDQEQGEVLNKLYQSKLMLYLPWRNEATDLLGGYMDNLSMTATDHVGERFSLYFATQEVRRSYFIILWQVPHIFHVTIHKSLKCLSHQCLSR